MTLTRWQRPVGFAPSRLTNSLQDDLAQLFQAFGDGFQFPASLQTAFAGVRLPAVDLYESNDLVTVKAELPGLKKEDINISLQDGVLTLSGERKETRQGETCRGETPGKAESGEPKDTPSDETAGACGCGRFVGRFLRTITLPAKVDANAVKAAYADGILTVELPKAQEAKPRRIAVNFN